MTRKRKRNTPHGTRGSDLAHKISCRQGDATPRADAVLVAGQSYDHPLELVREIAFLRRKLRAAKDQITAVSRQHGAAMSRALEAERKLKMLRAGQGSNLRASG